jgi:hypothetical protein
MGGVVVWCSLRCSDVARHSSWLGEPVARRLQRGSLRAFFLGEPRVRFAGSLVEVLGHAIRQPKVEEGSDIGIPNGPAEDSTRGLLKAHYPKNKKIREPKIY